ncbi:hypothetical protein VQ03_00285 [Methylobacterium tarhaniae]|uniref:Uncharacterized protein n=1 Tax=Methylobacterium tarhaniae TaxID=1187852 RepID=A0A0J6W081_9HYPH|nr:hypothetical protein VQ03_00285 [Methylobacterium tarhaniae]
MDFALGALRERDQPQTIGPGEGGPELVGEKKGEQVAFVLVADPAAARHVEDDQRSAATR